MNHGQFLVFRNLPTPFTFHNFESLMCMKLCNRITLRAKSEKSHKNFGFMKDDLSKEFGLLHNVQLMSMNITETCVRTAKYSRTRLVMHVTWVRVKKNACTIFFV